MKKIAGLFRRRNFIESEVDEELNFHLDMQAHDYQRRGLSQTESHTMAEARFGDVARIRKECIRISAGKTVLIWVLNAVFMMSLVMGLLLRMLIPEFHINRVGDVMMMIGGLGILLVYAKQAGANVLNSAPKHPLGLNQHSHPVGFDEKGRTPFDRVRSDD